MVLWQTVITWDDIQAFTANTSLTPITLLRDINIYDGPYKAKVVGFNWLDNKADAVAAANQQVINISSSRFSFPASSIKGINFTNRNEHVNASINGNLEFIINNTNGDLDIILQVQQFTTATRLKDNAATWNATGFIACILTLDLEKIQ